jgi:hypothetical protein
MEESHQKCDPEAGRNGLRGDTSNDVSETILPNAKQVETGKD